MLIGINPEKPENDPPCYDFFTSEERTTSFYAIARGDVPREHWKYLRRIPTVIGGYTALTSWTGTAFEYLMPSLLLPTLRGSLSYEALSSSVREQKKTLCQGVWGRSESGYFDFDRDLSYQYTAFSRLRSKTALTETRSFPLILLFCPCPSTEPRQYQTSNA